MSKVSVVIPAYNSGHIILETVTSVLEQTYSNFEIIIIDDGSTDQTIEHLQTLQDERIKIFPYENGGLATARNRGIAHTNGEFIAFLDHDDLWTPEKLEAQVQALQSSPNAGVAYSWTTYMHEEEDGNTRFVKGDTFHHEGHVYPQLLLQNFIGSGSNILARREAVESVGGFDSAPVSNEDWDFYLRLAKRWPFVVIPNFQVLYRQALSSMSSQVKRLEDGGLFLIDKTYNAAPTELQNLKNQSLSNHYLYCSELYLNQRHLFGLDRDTLRTFGIAIRLWPQSLLQLTTQIIFFKLISKLIFPPQFVQQLQKVKQKRFASPS